MVFYRHNPLRKRHKATWRMGLPIHGKGRLLSKPEIRMVEDWYIRTYTSRLFPAPAFRRNVTRSSPATICIHPSQVNQDWVQWTGVSVTVCKTRPRVTARARLNKFKASPRAEAGQTPNTRAKARNNAPAEAGGAVHNTKPKLDCMKIGKKKFGTAPTVP